MKLTTPKLPSINYGSGPEDGWFARPKDELLIQNFASTQGATLITEDAHATFPPIYKNLSVITSEQISKDSQEIIDSFLEDSDWSENTVKGALIQHEATGQTYFYAPGVYCLFPIADFTYETGVYENIILHPSSKDEWEKVSIDFDGTRLGGITHYDIKKWPHYKRIPLKFIGQYLLPDGRYIHMFSYIKSVLATSMDHGTNCAIVEGGPVPSWITLRPLAPWKNKNFVEYPNFAFTPIPKESNIIPTPYWRQTEAIPHDANYRFLMQFGAITIPIEDDSQGEFDELMIGDCGDWYLYYNSLTNEARLLAQFY